MALDYAALKSELNTDPQTYGYATFVTAGNDMALADLLNKLRDGTDGETAISIKRPDIAPSEILEQIDSRDFITTPNAAFCSWFESVTQLRSIRLLKDDGSNTMVIGNFARLINNTNGSQTRLSAVAIRVGTRAEQLFGPGVSVTPNDISIALRQT